MMCNKQCKFNDPTTSLCLNGIIDEGEVCDGSFMGCFNCLHVAKFWNCSSTPD